jgi:hypothetical protein
LTTSPPPQASTPAVIPKSVPLGPQLPDVLQGRAEDESALVKKLKAWLEKSEHGSGWADQEKHADLGAELIEAAQGLMEWRNVDRDKYGEINIFERATPEEIRNAVLRIAGDLAPGQDPGIWVGCRCEDIAARNPYRLVLIWMEEALRQNWEPPKNYRVLLPTPKQVLAALDEAEDTHETLRETHTNLPVFLGLAETELAEGPKRFTAERDRRNALLAEQNAQRDREAAKAARIQDYRAKVKEEQEEFENVRRGIYAKNDRADADKRQECRDAERVFASRLRAARAGFLHPGDLAKTAFESAYGIDVAQLEPKGDGHA